MIDLAIKLDFFYLVLGLVSIVNIIGFSIVGADKYKAKKNLWRIPEKTFFLIAVFGGAIGVYAGMLFFRHKTRHWYFMFGIPAILVTEAIIAFLLLKNS
ncbi:DUF1294 domain-containing protein [Acetivibrio cellulolyticus]|uniref:DUF1294 domain-containing protein n=1 Tax=Acetivibrio cellulolyticus TaxID=35830 RepID=UPI0001E2C213|nr:DUF1294 domain-containing protein [Acetivibrio cellulolyticus]